MYGVLAEGVSSRQTGVRAAKVSARIFQFVDTLRSFSHLINAPMATHTQMEVSVRRLSVRMPPGVHANLWPLHENRSSPVPAVTPTHPPTPARARGSLKSGFPH